VENNSEKVLAIQTFLANFTPEFKHTQFSGMNWNVSIERVFCGYSPNTTYESSGESRKRLRFVDVWQQVG